MCYFCCFCGRASFYDEALKGPHLACLCCRFEHVRLSYRLRTADQFSIRSHYIQDLNDVAGNPKVENDSMCMLMCRNVGKVFAAFRAAVRARMLIPVGLAAVMLTYNTANPEQPLTLAQEVRSRWPDVAQVSVALLCCSPCWLPSGACKSSWHDVLVPSYAPWAFAWSSR